LPATDRDAVRAHVLACAQCQTTLDRMSDNADLRQWLSHAQMLPEVEDTALTRLLHQLAHPTPPSSPSTRPELPPPRPEAAPEPSRPHGQLAVLGPYRLVAELGRGGMGIVYRAFDEVLQRTVAVKVMRADLGEETAPLRFLREARAAAALEHENVIRVHAVAESLGGLPYLVMEFIDGPTLADLIRSHQRLPPHEAAVLVREAAEGLAAAHAVGLIHRDVKPSNIIRDSRSGRVKVLDFGLALLAEGASALTKEGLVVGTPAYLSPEQARGQGGVDRRTDVYSLGVTLYHALTGEAPFRGTPAALLRQVREDEPRSPRRLSDAIPRDLETICLKAMAKAPVHRYQSARELADDLRRFVAGEPIQARPVGVLERGWRWCRRNPLVAGLGGSVAVLVLVLAIGSPLVAAWLYRERADALEARGEAVAHAQAANEHFRLALDTVKALIEQVKRLEGTPGVLAVKQQIAETALERLEQIAHSAEKTREVDQSLVAAHEQLSGLFFTLGKTAEARRQLELMRDRAEAWSTAEPESVPAKRAVALANDKLGDLDLYALDFKAAADHYRAAVKIREALAERDPGDNQTRREISVSHNKLGNLSLRTGDAETALSSFEEGLKWRLAAPSTNADKNQFLADMRFTHVRLGEASSALAEYETATLHYLKALAYAVQLLEGGAASGRRDVAACQELLGTVYRRLGDEAAAGEHWRLCLEARWELADADPGNTEAQRDTYRALSLLGGSYGIQGHIKLARAAYRQVVILSETIAAQDPGSLQKQADLGIYYARMADLEERTGRFAAAAEWMGQGAALYRRLEAGGKAATLNPRAVQEYYEGGQATYAAAARIGLDDLPTILRQDPDLKVKLLSLRCLTLARQGRHREAADTAEQMRKFVSDTSGWGESLARTFALCALAIDRLPGPVPPEMAGLRQRYADTAIEILRAYLTANPRSFYLVPDEPEYTAVRNHPGFRALLREMSRLPKSSGR
jgi:tRNA A-37 threonylcarbamoyl transferase component Bud32/tetratricopeptide (TPR) repeat protein